MNTNSKENNGTVCYRLFCAFIKSLKRGTITIEQNENNSELAENNSLRQLINENSKNIATRVKGELRKLEYKYYLKICVIKMAE